MKVKVYPCKLSGTAVVPASKSYAHRALICAALADGESKVECADMNDDIRATIRAVTALGAKVKYSEGILTVNGITGRVKEDIVIDCGESGSTLRFIIPVALTLCDGYVRFVGGGKLGERPLGEYFSVFDSQGIYYRNNSGKDGLDLTVRGDLIADDFELEGNISSQFVSGLLLAAPGLAYDSTITLSKPLESKDYVRITMDVMGRYGAVAYYDSGARKFTVYGGQKFNSAPYSEQAYKVEGDWSQAAFFYVARALGHDIDIKGVNSMSVQGDKVVADMLGMVKAVAPGRMLTLDVKNVPDIVPALSLACALRKGGTHIVNAGRLRIKECDRLHATAEGLNALGARVKEGKDDMFFDGVDGLKGGVQLPDYHDHRMVMTFAIAATVCENPVIITGAESVSKSYPAFFNDFEKLGGKYEILGSEV